MKFLKNICIRILIGLYFSKLLENLVKYFHIIFSVYLGLVCVDIYIYIYIYIYMLCNCNFALGFCKKFYCD